MDYNSCCKMQIRELTSMVSQSRVHKSPQNQVKVVELQEKLPSTKRREECGTDRRITSKTHSEQAQTLALQTSSKLTGREMRLKISKIMLPVPVGDINNIDHQVTLSGIILAIR